jgi:hypothetical protein
MSWKRAIVSIAVLLLLLPGTAILVITLWRNEFIANKELILVVKDVVTIITIVGGAYVTYYRFFKGRTFTAKADLEIDIQLLRTPNGTILHHVKCHLSNRGGITIWNPTAKIGIKRFYKGNKQLSEVIEGIRETSFFDDGSITRYFVDPGEKITFIYHQEHENDIWAVLYDVEVNSKSGAIWKSSTIIENRVIQ